MGILRNSLPSSVVTDHGALTGLADDDHTQYHNDTRGDARYIRLGHGVTQAACSDETSAITTGQKVAFRVVGAKNLVGVRASLTTAQASGSILTVDVRKNGTTVLSTLITIDNGEKTSTTAATPPVISVASFADDDEVTVHVTQVGTGSAGLKVSLLWG